MVVTTIKHNWCDNKIRIEPKVAHKCNAYSSHNNVPFHTVKNGVFRYSYLGCLYVHSSTTPNRVFLKPPFEGVTGHP